MKKGVVFIIFLLLGIIINLLPVPRGLLPYIGNQDALTYIELSRELDWDELSKLGFFEFLLGALNWLSLPLLLNVIDIETGYWRMMLINAVILYMIISQMYKLAEGTRVSGTVFTVVCMILMPYLWCWIFVPSKENITVIGFLLLFNIYTGRQTKASLPIALGMGLFKTQLIVGFFVTEALKKIKYHYFFLSLLAVNIISILIYKYFEAALSVELWLTYVEDTINTAGLILFLESLIKIPVLGILAVLIRLIIYFVAGISAVKNMFTNVESFLMNFSSVNVGILSIIFLVFIRRMKPAELKLLWSLVVVFLFIPFIQFRYFWWTIPFLLFFILRKVEPESGIKPEEDFDNRLKLKPVNYV